MMQIALIADIHGNLAALDAVLRDIEALGIDQVVCLGDVAATGPQPHAVVQRLQQLRIRSVMGNTDAAVIDPHPPTAEDPDRRRIEEIDWWCAAQLDAAERAFLQTFEPTIDIPLGNGASLLCFHGSPRSYNDVITSTTNDEELMEMLGTPSATVLAGGHTHTAMLRRYGTALLLNPGSVGLPYERDYAGNVRNPPWTEYAVLDGQTNSLNIEFRRVLIDAALFRQTITESGMPHAAWLVSDWV
jgi:predicted phosphodiesterase